MTSMEAKPLVYVIVLNYNDKLCSLECIESVLQIDYCNFQVVFVDNGSTDGSVIAIRERFGADVRLHVVENRENLGIAGGNNAGIRYALKQGADYIMILSNDTKVSPDSLRRMVDTAQSDSRIGLVGGKILYYNEPDVVWFAGAKFDPWLARAPHIGVNQLDNMLSGVWDVDMLMGCAMLIKREVVEQVGLFDERYFFQNEDLEFSYRVRKAGWKIKVNMDARIWHKIGRTIGTESYDRWYYATRNRLLFIEENLPPIQRLTAKIFFALTRPLKFIEWIVQGRLDLIQATLEGWNDYRHRRLGRRLSIKGL